ncbi:hypothetical protein ACWD4O_26560 [Streptomyces sp. NPDC002623]
MPAVTADRTPGQLVVELERLIGVDWPTVWAGVPEDEEKQAGGTAEDDGPGGRPAPKAEASAAPDLQKQTTGPGLG